jgi:hypothetical protein
VNAYFLWHPGEYAHEYNGRFVVAEYRDGRYYAPQRSSVRKLTGCHTTFGPLSYVAGDAYSYTRRGRAIAKAEELYGTPVL